MAHGMASTVKPKGQSAMPKCVCATIEPSTPRRSHPLPTGASYHTDLGALKSKKTPGPSARHAAHGGAETGLILRGALRTTAARSDRATGNTATPVEAQVTAALRQQCDQVKGRPRAFLEKRAPMFRGR